MPDAEGVCCEDSPEADGDRDRLVVAVKPATEGPFRSVSWLGLCDGPRGPAPGGERSSGKLVIELSS